MQLFVFLKGRCLDIYHDSYQYQVWLNRVGSSTVQSRHESSPFFLAREILSLHSGRHFASYGFVNVNGPHLVLPLTWGCEEPKSRNHLARTSYWWSDPCWLAWPFSYRHEGPLSTSLAHSPRPCWNDGQRPLHVPKSCGCCGNWWAPVTGF